MKYDGPAVALIVEDKTRALNTRRQLFDAYGFHSVGARTFPEALLEVRSNPAIDIVVTDINLDAPSGKDRSGLELARQARKFRPRLPVVGYSGLFAEDDLKKEEWKLFDAYLPKGKSGPVQLQANLEEWKRIALSTRRSRTKQALDELKRMKMKYNMRDADFEVLREFIPGGRTNSEEDGDEGVPDDVLRRLGYRLRLVECGSKRPTVDNGTRQVTATIPLWVRQEDQKVVVEVYGYPTLYAHGDMEEDAINNVLLLMDGFCRDFHDEPDTPDTAEMRSLRVYLQKVLG
jgi:CheY-like chemotaxis protein